MSNNCVCIISSDEYAKYSMVTITSLCINNPYIKDVYILSNYLSEKSLEDYSLTATKFKINLTPIIIDERRLDWLNTDSRWPKFAMSALLINELLPVDIERCLILEVDTMVTGDISPLFEINMDQYTIAGSPIGFGVTKTADPKQYTYKDEEVVERRINGGVVLFNMINIRKHGINLDYYQRKYIEEGMKTITGEVLLSSVHKESILYLNTAFFNYRTMYQDGYVHRKYNIADRRIVHFTDRRLIFQKPWIMEFDDSDKEKYFLEKLNEFNVNTISELHKTWWNYAKYAVNYKELRFEMNIRKQFYLSIVLGKLYNPSVE